MASEERAGIMPGESFSQIEENTTRIEALEGRALHYSVTLTSDAPTQAELQDAYELASGETGAAPDQVTLDDTAYNKSYTWYETSEEWVDRGSSTVAQFTNSSAGTIKGSNTSGKVFAENDGTGSVVGWDETQTAISNLGTVATESAKGLMSAADKAKLDSIESSRFGSIVIGSSLSGYNEGQVDYLCDGEDDDVEINAAIASLTDGGEIVLLEGTYNTSKHILMGTGKVTLRGMGDGTVINKTVFETGGVTGDETKSVIFIDSEYNRIEKLKITTSDLETDADENFGILIGKSNNTIIGNNIANVGASMNIFGIMLNLIQASRAVDNITISGNIIANTGTNPSSNMGIYGLSNSNVVITENHFLNLNNGGNVYAIYCNSVHCLTFANNVIETNGGASSMGVNLLGGECHTIIGNVIKNRSQYSTYGIYLNRPDKTTVSGNVIANETGTSSILGNTSVGIGYDNSIGGRSIVISGNTISNTGGSTNHGVRSQGAGISFIGNTFSNNNITGSHAADAVAFAFYSSKGERCLFQGNNLYGVTVRIGNKAYMQDGTSANLPGSPTAIATLGTAGSCGFNIV
jgi:hypothetical protein